MPNKAEWCSNDRVHLEHVERIAGQVVICDGLPPHPDVALVVREALEEHDEQMDYDGLPYTPHRCYACGYIEETLFDDHVAFNVAKAVLDLLRPFLNFPKDGDDGPRDGDIYIRMA